MDLSVLTGWEHESFGIGDVVTVDDKDLGIRISTRIIRMDYNVQEPWKTVIELSTKLKELGDSFVGEGSRYSFLIGFAGQTGDEGFGGKQPSAEFQSR